MNRLFTVLSLLFFLSCKDAAKDVRTETKNQNKTDEVVQSQYPLALQKIFEAHGGLTNWKAKKSLVFEIPKPSGREKHTIDLHSRKGKIETPDFSIGFDGKDVWLLDEGKNYKGDPVFYHNLMFYFYAMPFVLADSGIKYAEAEDLEFQGKVYPGIHISYDIGVGTSYKDEYFIHYDPETHTMEWLGYTVTYRSGEKSNNVKWIRYGDWANVNGLSLPKSITWHIYEGRTIKEARNQVDFENIEVHATAMPSSFFSRPDNAEVIKRKKAGKP